MKTSRMKASRTEKGISQWELAVLMGTYQARISLLENGYALPTEEEKKRIAKILGVRPEEIFPNEKTARMAGVEVQNVPA